MNAAANARAKPKGHVVIDFAGPRNQVVLAPEEQLVLRCKNCDGRYVLALPASLAMCAAVCKQYGREHRRCKPQGLGE